MTDPRLAPLLKKVYLGDGAYLQWDGYHYILTAENGIIATDTVYLDGQVLKAFCAHVEFIEAGLKGIQEDTNG